MPITSHTFVIGCFPAQDLLELPASIANHGRIAEALVLRRTHFVECDQVERVDLPLLCQVLASLSSCVPFIVQLLDFLEKLFSQVVLENRANCLPLLCVEQKPSELPAVIAVEDIFGDLVVRNVLWVFELFVEDIKNL